MKKVIRLTESDLMRIVKRVIAENDSEMEEGWLGDKLKGLKRFSKGYGDEEELGSKREEFMAQLEEFDNEVMENPDDYVKGNRWDEYREDLIAKAEDNNFMGSLRRRTSPNSDKYFIVYFPGTTGLQKMASGAGGSVRSGMSNTNIAESRRRYSRRLNEGSLIGQPIGTTGYKLTDASGMGSPICQVTVSIQNIKNPSDTQTFTDGQGGLEKINKLTNQSLKNELLNIRSAKRRELGCN